MATLSPANRRAVDAMALEVERRLFKAQQSHEGGDLEFNFKVALLRGQVRGLRFRLPEERIALDSGGETEHTPPQ